MRRGPSSRLALLAPRLTGNPPQADDSPSVSGHFSGARGGDEFIPSEPQATRETPWTAKKEAAQSGAACYFLVREGGLEPPSRKPGLGPQPSASANSATLALETCRSFRDSFYTTVTVRSRDEACRNPGRCERALPALSLSHLLSSDAVSEVMRTERKKAGCACPCPLEFQNCFEMSCGEAIIPFWNPCMGTPGGIEP